MASSRYASIDRPSSSSSSSSHRSDPSPPPPLTKKPSLKQIISGGHHRPSDTSRALARTRCGNDLAPTKAKSAHTFGTMVKKFMEKRSNLKPGSAERGTLFVPADTIAADLKKTTTAAAKGGSNLSTLHRKLFPKGGLADRAGTGKALMEVKANTRTLAMVLRSERELLSQNKEHELEISELRIMIEEKDREVEKLKDLCFKQREEIKVLKDAILFPDVMNLQLQELLEKRGFELKQAKQVIPSLQKQVSSLTGQIQSLQEDLAKVKADKYTATTSIDRQVNSPRTPVFDLEAANSLEYSSGDPITSGYGSPDDMFLEDLNPCLTPCFAKTRSKEYDDMFAYDSPNNEGLLYNLTSTSDISSFSHGGIISKSLEHCESPSLGGSTAHKIYKSDENKRSAGKLIYQKLFGI